MKDTCDFKNCSFAGLINKPEECPNFLHTSWRDNKTNEVTVIKDCSPKRMLYMMQDMSNRIISLQAALEGQRNVGDKILGMVKAAVDRVNRIESKEVIDATEIGYTSTPD